MAVLFPEAVKLLVMEHFNITADEVSLKLYSWACGLRSIQAEKVMFANISGQQYESDPESDAGKYMQ